MNQRELFEPELPAPAPALTLTPHQSLALRRMIEALKSDDSIYEACPAVIRDGLASIYLSPYSSAEQEILDLRAANDEALKLLEKFGARIRDLEQRRAHGQSTQT